jgi:hypothetical protein
MRNEDGEKIVLCFDRDYTVSVNPHPDERAVPIGWLQYWAHELEIPVWATGNQHLRTEAKIPGIREAEFAWKEYVDGGEYEYDDSQFEDYWQPRRRDGLRIVRDVYESTYPDEDFRFVVVDDVDVSDLSEEGPWTHYFPWDFVEAVENGEFALDEPPEDAYRNDGVPFNSTDDPDFSHEKQRELQEIRTDLHEHPVPSKGGTN